MVDTAGEAGYRQSAGIFRSDLEMAVRDI